MGGQIFLKEIQGYVNKVFDYFKHLNLLIRIPKLLRAQGTLIATFFFTTEASNHKKNPQKICFSHENIQIIANIY